MEGVPGHHWEDGVEKKSSRPIMGEGGEVIDNFCTFPIMFLYMPFLAIVACNHPLDRSIFRQLYSVCVQETLTVKHKEDKERRSN